MYFSFVVHVKQLEPYCKILPKKKKKNYTKFYWWSCFNSGSQLFFFFGLLSEYLKAPLYESRRLYCW